MKKLILTSLFAFLALIVTAEETIVYAGFNEEDYTPIESFYYIESDAYYYQRYKYRIVTKLMDYEVDDSGRQLVYVLTEDSDLFTLIHRGDQLPNRFGIDQDFVEIFLHVEFQNYEALFVIDAVKLMDDDSMREYYTNKYQDNYSASNIIYMIQDGNQDLKDAIEKKLFDVNLRYDYGYTLLLEALYMYDDEIDTFLEMAEYLIQNGADPNIPDEDGVTPLLYAVDCIDDKADLWKVVEFLLQKGADVNVKTNDDETILYELCSSYDVDMDLVKFFIEKGAPLNISAVYDCTPLTYALYHEDIELAKLLIESGADVNLIDSDKDYPLILACEIGDFDFVKYMLDKGAKVNVANEYGQTPLHEAVDSISEDNFKIVKLLVENGADVNATNDYGYTPLIYAGWDYNTGFEMIKYLVSKNADINAKTDEGYNVGMSSARLANLECCEFLADNGFDFTAKDEEEKNPFHYFMEAISSYDFFISTEIESLEGIKACIKFYASKCDINEGDYYNYTVLHIEAESVLNSTEIMEALIENGADVNALNDWNRTPIFYSIGDTARVQCLIDHGADLSIRDKNGKTCLDFCEENIKHDHSLMDSADILKANMKEEKVYSFVQLVEYNYFEKACEMLENGKAGGLNDYGSDGFTPLYYAVFNKNYELIDKMLEAGCDINQRMQKNDTTVLYYAVKENDLELVSFLLKYNPDLNMTYENDWSDDKEDTVLFMATNEYDNHDVIKCLLEAGADPNAVIEKSSGMTITAYNCCYGNEDDVELLIEYGGNPFATWTSNDYWFSGPETCSIITEYLDYWEEYAVYSGLEKYFQDKIYVATDNLRIRDNCGLDSTAFIAMKKGTRVKIHEACDMEVIDDIHSCWGKIEVLPGSFDSQGNPLAEGTTGWCFLGYLEQEQ